MGCWWSKQGWLNCASGWKCGTAVSSIIPPELPCGLGSLRIPLPRWLAPTVTAREALGWQTAETDISVRVSLPVLRLLISYEGLMTRSAEDA